MRFWESVMSFQLKQMSRLENFVTWYKHLRSEGVRIYGEDQLDLPLYARYNKFNCLRWAWSNSKTHYTNGKYFK
jgi:hypothetical protein